MYINREDKGIFLMILAIVIVSVIAFVAVIGIIWNIISPGVNQLINSVSTTVRTSNIDYNFYVPPREDVVVEDTSEQTPAEPETPTEDSVVADKDYNFKMPEFEFPLIEGIPNYFEVVREDVKGLSNIYQPKLGESARIQVNKIHIDSPIIQEAQGDRAMNAGFWVYTNLDNKKFPDTGITLTCYRRYFDSTDPRSCYFLHYLFIDDEIKLFSDGREYTYKITGKGEFDTALNDIYSVPEIGNIKIVSSSLDGKLRYVITAKQL